MPRRPGETEDLESRKPQEREANGMIDSEAEQTMPAAPGILNLDAG